MIEGRLGAEGKFYEAKPQPYAMLQNMAAKDMTGEMLFSSGVPPRVLNHPISSHPSVAYENKERRVRELDML